MDLKTPALESPGDKYLHEQGLNTTKATIVANRETLGFDKFKMKEKIRPVILRRYQSKERPFGVL